MKKVIYSLMIGAIALASPAFAADSAKPAAKDAPKDTARKDDPENLRPGPAATVKPVVPLTERLLNIK